MQILDFVIHDPKDNQRDMLHLLSLKCNATDKTLGELVVYQTKII
ncbi:hypothetical protein GLYMA_18G277900v4 [Glycine max]|uniref:Uncharacterized protein n=1 Tax=Glycine max TaxID=3847 RepID=A0A0R0FFS5_SOYBN|nr:hypothetical protein GYH30_051324 [Glycine max]KRH01451.1 hypothetical protein GLYMA_18G277900v4 [Glycine max]